MDDNAVLTPRFRFELVRFYSATNLRTPYSFVPLSFSMPRLSFLYNTSHTQIRKILICLASSSWSIFRFRSEFEGKYRLFVRGFSRILWLEFWMILVIYVMLLGTIIFYCKNYIGEACKFIFVDFRCYLMAGSILIYLHNWEEKSLNGKIQGN